MNDHLVPRDQVSPGDRAAMFSLLDRHYENVTRQQFESDLEEKNWVILLHDARGRLRGFTTFRFEAHDGPASGPCHLVTSGDTIVDPEAWGSTALLRAWLRGVMSLRSAGPAADRPVYWLLITSGFRTYRFMPTFWNVFYPRHDAPTPIAAQRRIDALARARYGDAYDAKTGIVHLPRPQRLRPHLQGVPDSRRIDPHTAFFTECNPGHAAGDELVTITEISEENLTRAGRRILHILRSPGRVPKVRMP